MRPVMAWRPRRMRSWHCIAQLCADVGLPARLRDIGVERKQIPDLVRSSRGNSMDGNPRLVSDEELTRLLEEAL